MSAATTEAERGWRQRAACATPIGRQWADAAVDDKTSDGARLLERLCRRCPVAAECLADAMTFPARGIWGGTKQNSRTRHGAPVFGQSPASLR